ncbi:MAG: hypothetical protein KME21_24255 [Desmonostoc vinosum HA7617-LM4]|nr:hypothetical protein [Desmonostoc vinosum HA7617-LM4]
MTRGRGDVETRRKFFIPRSLSVAEVHPPLYHFRVWGLGIGAIASWAISAATCCKNLDLWLIFWKKLFG